MKLHSSAAHLLQFFKNDHLPVHLRTCAEAFEKLAFELAGNLPSNPEATMALRKLLEAKDCAVRAIVAGDPKVSS